jgi:hypothetical protein
VSKWFEAALSPFLSVVYNLTFFVLFPGPDGRLRRRAAAVVASVVSHSGESVSLIGPMRDSGALATLIQTVLQPDAHPTGVDGDGHDEEYRERATQALAAIARRAASSLHEDERKEVKRALEAERSRDDADVVMTRGEWEEVLRAIR